MYSVLGMDSRIHIYLDTHKLQGQGPRCDLISGAMALVYRPLLDKNATLRMFPPGSGRFLKEDARWLDASYPAELSGAVSEAEWKSVMAQLASSLRHAGARAAAAVQRDAGWLLLRLLWMLLSRGASD